MKIKIFNNKLNRGFTLVEILVAALIFGIAIATAVGIFAVSNNVQTKTEIIRTAVQSERLALEQISRDVRMAKEGFEFCRSVDDCGYEATFGASMIKIKFGNNKFKYYQLNSADNTFNKSEDGINWYSMFPAEFKITADVENVFNGYFPSSASKEQPYLKIKLKIDNSESAFKESEKINETIETTVTSRAYSEVGIWKKN